MKKYLILSQDKSSLVAKAYKKVFVIAFTLLLLSFSGFAHTVDGYTATCNTGPVYSVDANVSSVNSLSNYAWQYKNASNVWVCIVNGNNTINGNTYSVSGASSTATTNPAPIVFSTPAGLQGLIIRCVISDGSGVNPCNTPAGNTWNSDAASVNHTINVNNTPCGVSSACPLGGVNLGSAANFSVLGLTNTFVNLHNVTVNGGRVGVSQGGTINFASASTVNGDLFLNTGVTNSGGGILNGTLYTNQNLSQAVTDATNAANAASALAPTQTFTTWNATTTVTGNGGQNVIQVGSVNLSGSSIITLSGGASDYFVINITGGFTMGGSGAIKTSGVSSSHVLVNVVGTGTDVTSQIGNMVNGTLLVLSRNVIFHGVTGQVICGGSEVKLMSSAQVDYVSSVNACSSGSIGDRIWNDTNKNGLQDNGEVGVAGIAVSLYNANNLIVASTTTDAFGNYLFSGLAVSSGGTNYQVRFSLPAGYKFSPQNADAAGTAGANNSDADIITGRTGTIALTAAAPNVSYADAGIYYSVSARIGDFVWNDINKDGVQNNGEPGIAGVTVMLYTSADVLFRATITSNSGQYLFTDVPAGTYYIKVAPPIGYQVSAKDAGSDNTDSDIDPVTRKTANIVVVAGTNDLSFDAGLNVTPNTGASASLGDRVWNDLNSNNLQDANEPGVADVTVQLYNSANLLQATITTDAFGYYMFNGLSAGSYYVKFTLPSGFTFVTAAVGANRDIDSDPATGTGQTGSYSLVADQIRTNVDAGIKRTASTAALGDFVWYDLDKDGVQDGGAELGVPGITVILYNSSNAIVQTTTTDANGFYLFTGLPAATAYTVGFSNIPAGYGFSPMSGAVTVTNNSDVNPATGRTGTVTTGAAGTSITYADAGLIITPNTFNSKGSIGDKVWNDLNNNGVQDANEPGVQGVTVTLYAPDGTTVITTTTTDAQGNYIFTNLDAGSYVIGFSGLPSGYVFATQDAGSNDGADSDPASGTGKTGPVSLAAGEINLTIDAGVRNTTVLSNLGDFVWYDFDNDGIQDAGEPGVAGVSVALLDVNFNVIATTTTTANGAFLFTDLVNGSYYLQFGNLPSGYVATTKGATGAGINSDANTTTLRTDVISLPSVTTDRTWDLGILSLTKASIGDFVWNDLNRNGVQDAGEPGVAGITVTLYDNTGTAIASAITDAAGFYFFPNVNPGTYTVGFSTIPANAGFTAQDTGNDATDSDVIPSTGKTASFTLAAGQVNTTIDAGLVTLLAAVGNYVWRDALPNGTQDASEVGVPGITVTLYTSSNAIIGDADDAAVASAVTDARGYYFINNIPVAAGGSQFYIRFTDLQANNTFTIPLLGGTSASNNSKVTTQPATNGRTGFFTLTPGQIYLDVDAGLIGVDNGALPLHHLDLKAVLHSNTVDLTWIAENEMNTARFVIQRSVDGVNYSDIGSKDPVGPVNIPAEYKSTDDIQSLLSSNIIYYRIKAEDNNSRYAYSNIVTVRLSKVTGIQVWPNPFVSDVRISYKAAANTNLTVRMADNTGKTIIQNNVSVTRGLNQFSLSGIETLPSGIYLISITDNNTNERFVQKLMK
jgi:hypothetical protein